MLKNLVSLQDLRGIARDLRANGREALRRLLRGNRDRTRAAWAPVPEEPVNWWNVPAVHARWNRAITGSKDVDYVMYTYDRYLLPRRPVRGLSLGCGNGDREIYWSTFPVFERIDAFDLSEGRIALAQRKARERGVDGIVSFSVGDVATLALRDDHYDVFIGENSVHHMSPLEAILRRIRAALRPGGLVVLNEFVGPTRFQWTDRQLRAINELLDLLPASYRLLSDGKTLKPRLERPTITSMLLIDPSEAVESASILPLCDRLFERVELRPYGGAVLHMLLAGIAHHFHDPEPEASRLLQLFFDTEDDLMRRGEIGSDFVHVVYRKPEG